VLAQGEKEDAMRVANEAKKARDALADEVGPDGPVARPNGFPVDGGTL
jgi:hypothetical protein